MSYPTPEGSARFQAFAKICDAIGKTRSKLEKIKILAEYLASLEAARDLNIAATFLSGRVFPPGEKEANVGYSTLWNVIMDVTSYDEKTVSSFYRKHGDLGYALEDMLRAKAIDEKDRVRIRGPGESKDNFQTTLFRSEKWLTLGDVYLRYLELSKSSGSGSLERKRKILKGLFSNVTIPEEAKYIVKILTVEMRIGLVEGLLEESIAKAFQKSVSDVRTASLIMADPGGLAVRAREDSLSGVSLRPLHPTNFMLADNAPTAEALFQKFDGKTIRSEFKYDGIRAQLHVQKGAVRIFSRNLADVTKFFPELGVAGKQVEDGLILDGEIIAFADGKPLSFQLLQRRLRKIVHSELDAPIRYMIFDVLYSKDRSLLTEPLRTRVEILRSIELPEGVMGLSEQRPISTAREIYEMFLESKNLGYEGLVVKDLDSSYSPGRRGGNWIKLKKELDTLDVVIVACEYGHGKRAGVISDYTFAVRGENGTLKVVGKAYSGLTDIEIAEMTETMKSITIKDMGYRRTVRPQVILEVAFDAITKSDRHDSGFALRFPRIKRIRTDKSLREIDGIDRVKMIYESQKVRVY